MDGKEEDDPIRNRVEYSAHVQNPLHLDALPRKRLVPDLIAWPAFEDLDYAGADIKADDGDHEANDPDIEGAPFVWGEDTAVKNQNCHFRQAYHEPVHDGTHVKPEGHFVRFLGRDVPHVQAAAVRHGVARSTKEGDGASP